MAGPRSQLRDEAGFTLVEIIVAIVILALSATALIGGLSTAIRATSLHRRQAIAQTLLVSATESVKRQAYQSGCLTSPTYDPALDIDIPSSPPTWSIEASTEYWNQGLGSWQASPCIPAVLQRIKIQIREDGELKQQEFVWVVKRPS